MPGLPKTTSAMALLAVFTVLVFVASASGAVKHHVNCEVTWEKVGCFNDNPKRALPIELINDRDVTSLNYKGYRLSWKNFANSTHSLACRCAAAARQKGYKVFGLQFFAECWSGPGGELSFHIHGEASKEKCYQDIYNPKNVHCDKAKKQECVGGVWTNYVYRLKDETPSVDTDGGYSKWSEWTKCSKTCGGGQRSRERTCTNPKPEGQGKTCVHLGPAEESKPCGQQECPKPCTKALDVGIILDVSSSVTLPHFKTAINFIKNLMKYFRVSPDDTHFGTITYSTNAHLQFTMADSRFYDYKSLAKKMDEITYYGGSTFTDRALEMASNELFTLSGGDRPEKPNVLIVFTDGKTNSESKPWLQVLGPLWHKNVRVVAVGIGESVDMQELKYITYFDQRYAIHVNSFDDLVEKMTIILNDSCEGKGGKK